MTTSMGSTLPLSLQERLCRAACNGSVENIRALVKEGAEVVLCDGKGFTALHYAAYYGNVETVRVIIELGGNAHPQDEVRKNTPLHCAAGVGHSETVKLFVEELGANVHAQNANGGTPLH
jgi:ankyrin repeat protein